MGEARTIAPNPPAVDARAPDRRRPGRVPSPADECAPDVGALEPDGAKIHANPNEVPIDGGTRVEVLLRTNPTEPGGLLYRDDMFSKNKVLKLDEMIARIAPACDVDITVTQDGKLLGSTSAGDWLEVPSGVLVSRITGKSALPKKTQVWEKLSELRDDDGRIYGRARIDPANEWASLGLLTVDGLAASKISMIAGVMMGVETTASRNAAKPIVPAPVLAAWSSEQAIVLGKAAISDAEKARAAALVMACGGEVANLPVAFWAGTWMTAAEFVEGLQSTYELVLYEGELSHEEDDDVTKRTFEAEFEVDIKIVHTVNERLSRLNHSEWIKAVTQGSGATPMDVIEELIVDAWGDETTKEEDTLCVGKVNGIEIFRPVTVYRRLEPEDQLHE